MMPLHQGTGVQSALVVDRLQFAFTITFHYIFPQITMGLALLILILKTMALRTGDEHYRRAARFWAKIFGINFAVGVVTGIPMEFQFGTNWSAFSQSAGGVIGQTLAMEGVFSFFLESSFLGLFLFGEKRLGRVGHWFSALMVFFGSWLSGYFIVATDAWMQHPVGYPLGPNGAFGLKSFWGLLLNPWTLWQYPHTMLAAMQTGCFVMAAIGAFYALAGRHEDYGRTFVRVGVIVGLLASILQLYPTGDAQGVMLARYQPVTLAAMEGLFHTEHGAPLAILGQPDVAKQRLDNPLIIPRGLSFLTYRRWTAEVKGLDQFPRDAMAGPNRARLFQLSHHGWTRNHLHRHFCDCRFFALARSALSPPHDALGDYARAAVPIHCQHGRMDHCGGWPPTVAYVRTPAHIARPVAARIGGQRMVHADRLHGFVHVAGDFVFVFGVPRDRARPGR